MRPTDWLALAAAACLIAVGPAMAVQEFARSQEQAAQKEVTGTLAPPDEAYRASWRFPLTVLVLAAGVLGTWTAARALLDKNVRVVSGRLLAILLAGLALLYVAYYVDGADFASAPYVLRGATIVWAYPIAGILMGGSVHRLAQLAEHFGRANGRAADDLAFRI